MKDVDIVRTDFASVYELLIGSSAVPLMKHFLTSLLSY